MTTYPSDALLQFCLDNDLTDILINRNEFSSFRVTGTGTHAPASPPVRTKTSSTRKYNCPCCGNSLEDQTKALQAYGCQEIVTEAYTGKSMERPQFSMLFQKLREGDTLVVTKLDRFARTAIDGVSAVRELFDRGVRVHILNMGLIENTLTGNLILTVLLAFAEYERGMIVERTQTGKAIARQDPNYREGRPKKFTKPQLGHAMELLDSGKSYKQVEALTGISKSTLIRTRRA